MKTVATLLLLLPFILSGPDDTIDQLRVAFSNVPLADQVTGAAVIVEEGEAPAWIEGSLVRHACGAYGETGSTSDMLNRVGHVFDCIVMGQSYSFHEGEVTFSGKYYDSNIRQIWENYEEDMNQSSVYWGCIYADQNRTAIDKEGSNMYADGKPSMVPAVAWWKVGNEVLAMSEWPSGDSVDVHNNKYLEHYAYDDGDWTDGWDAIQSPAHEHYDENGKIWSSAGMIKQDGDTIVHLKRVVFTLDPETRRREIVGEFAYADIDLTKCTGMGDVYPDPEGRLRNIHSFQMTENYIIIPETSYMHDPCTWVFHNDSINGWNEEYHYESTQDAKISIMEKTTGNFVAHLNAPAMFTTHMLGAYEDPDAGLLYFDILKYENAEPYTKWTFVEVPLSGETHPEGAVTATRYEIHMNPWGMFGMKNLANDDFKKSLEFSNINPAYQGKPYQFAYMITNMYNRHGSLIKLNVDNGSILETEFPNGLFPTEPIFLASPNAVSEDDGVLMISGIDGGREKGFLMVFNATNLERLYHATAPKLTLFGVHAKFFPFDAGCEEDDCTPGINN